jgi:gliding motility-associated protein GldE
VISALISGSEVAFFSLDPSSKKSLQDSKSRRAESILQLLALPKELLATILITNNLVNVGIIILSTYITSSLFYLESFPVFAFIFQVIAVTFLILLFGEVIPKVYATRHALRLAEIMAFPITLLKRILSPISFLLISSTSVIEGKIKQKGHSISVDELSDALELTNDPEIEEEKLLQGIVRFGSTDVKQIMKARVDATAIDIEMKYDDLFELIKECGFSRIPVYQTNLDNVIGILYIKDLLASIDLDQSSKGNKDIDWGELVRNPFFVPENKKIDDLLKEFQEKKIHLAIVVDEYGGTSGIVTLEDIIEEIVGEISDEYDDDELSYSKLDDCNYVFEGKTPLNDLYRIIGIKGDILEEAKGDSDTLGGLIIELVGRIPKKNERLNFHNLLFFIEASDKRKIKRVKITIQNPDANGIE